MSIRLFYLNIIILIMLNYSIQFLKILCVRRDRVLNHPVPYPGGIRLLSYLQLWCMACR